MKIINKYKVLRPIFGDVEYDEDMPVIKKEQFDFVDWDQVEIVNFKSSKSVKNFDKTIVELFNYDDVLESFWNNPFNHVLRFQKMLAVASPDFSIYPGMNRYQIEHNVYKNRWIGATWQSIGLRVIPTISWGDETTYQIAFKGIEKGSVVIVSTLGCTKSQDTFIKGYNKMMEIIEPKLVIVVGKMIKGIFGKIIRFDYSESFSKKERFEQLHLFEPKRIIDILKGGIENGK